MARPENRHEPDEKVRISFKRLETLLKWRGLNWQLLRNAGISPAIVQKMRDRTGHTDTRTIQKVCELLKVQPGEIMEYIPETPKETKAEEQTELKTEPKTET